MKNEIWTQKPIIAPSLICLDLCNLEQQVQILWEQGIRVLHVDILDGHFSPSMPLGLDTVRQLRKKTPMLFDVHLMVTEHDFFIRELLDIGVQQITFHIECESHIDRQINTIKNAGVRAGVALKPATSLEGLQYIVGQCDTVLLMLVNPGYAGHSSEKQVPYARRKIENLRDMIRRENPEVLIELDGRISIQDIEMYALELTDIFVVGSTCLTRDNLQGSLERLGRIRNVISMDIKNGNAKIYGVDQ